ncbi:RNA polymerase subunit RPO18, partial [Monkeypox virus]
MSSFVTNGY